MENRREAVAFYLSLKDVYEDYHLMIQTGLSCSMRIIKNVCGDI